MADNYFPSDYVESLTMLYLQSQDLSGTSPEDLANLYWTTYYRIYDAGKAAFHEAKSARRSSQ